MWRPRSNFVFAVSALLIGPFAWVSDARSAPATPSDLSAPPCAVVSDVSGSVQVLNDTRTEVSEAVKRAPLACGTWMSIGNGWAKVRHRDGYELSFGPGTFFQLTDPGPGPKPVGDQLVLYRGQVHANAESGAIELRVLTANGRARLKQGSIILVYNREQQETQLIAISHEAVLENRFDPAARLTVKEGEASSLNLELQRVVPTASRAIAVSALRGRLVELHVREQDQSRALKVAQGRHDRKIASQLEEIEGTTGLKGRPQVADKPDAYLKHQPDEVDEALNRKLASRMRGGAPVSGHRKLSRKLSGHKSQIEVKDLEDRPAPKAAQSAAQLKEAAEKQKIIEELTQIKEE